MSRTRRATLSYASGLLQSAITLATGLVATPLLLGWLGEDRFGTVRILAQWAGFLALLELGLGGALQPLLARSLGVGDEPGLRRTVVAGVRAYVRATLLVLVVGTAIGPFVDQLVLTPDDRAIPGLAADLRRAWMVGLIGFLPWCLAPFKALTDARQLGYRINLMLAGQGLLITGASLVLARAGWGITGQAVAAALGTLPMPAVLAWMALRRHPGLLGAVATAPADPGARRDLRGQSVPTMAMTLCGQVSLVTDYIVVGRILGAAAAASLFVTQRLVNLSEGYLGAVGNASWAALAELHAQGRHRDFNDRLIELSRLVAILGCAALGPIVAYNRRFFGLWMGLAHDPLPYGGDAVVVVATVNCWMLALGSLWGWCIRGTGHVRVLVPASVASATLNLVASVALTRWLGMVGPLAGTTAAILAVNSWYLPRVLHRLFGVSRRRLALASLGPLALGVPYAALWRWIAAGPRPAGWGWIGLAAEMSCAGLGFLAAAYALLIGPADRDLWRARASGVLGPIAGRLRPRRPGPAPVEPADA